MARHHETLFFVTPIGAPGTPERLRSDRIHQELLAPVCGELGIAVQRADWINEPTALLTRILQFLLESELVVCDFSGGNPNVYYEAGVRHCTGLPTVHLARPGEELPFDLKDQLTLFVDDRSDGALRQLRPQLKQILEASRNRAGVLNPVTIAARLSGAQFSLRLGAARKLAAPESANLAQRDWSGLWLTNFGRVLVRQRGTRLTGLYEHHSDGWEGTFTGLVGTDALWFAFPLKDSAFPGVARIDPRRPDSYGQWIHAPHLATVEDLRDAWEQDPKAVRKLARLWKLYGKLDATGTLQVLDSHQAPPGDYLEFALREGRDARGRTYEELLSLPDEAIERDGDFLSWLFPEGGPEGNFPGVAIEDHAVLRRSEEYRSRLRKAFLVVLRFYGFQLRESSQGVRVEKSPHFDQRKREWVLVGHYHYSRIARVLRYLCGFGMAKEARAWFAALQLLQKTEFKGFMRSAIRNWRTAVGLDREIRPVPLFSRLFRKQG